MYAKSQNLISEISIGEAEIGWADAAFFFSYELARVKGGREII